MTTGRRGNPRLRSDRDGATPADVLAAYDRKYTWTYDVGAYGELTVVEVGTVLAWRTAGWAGRDSFVASGRWRAHMSELSSRPPAAAAFSAKWHGRQR